MIHAQEIWDIIQIKMPRGCWISLEEIYQIVDKFGDLDHENFEWQSPTSDIPKWKRNVRNVLQRRKGKREINWDWKVARYLLP